MKSKTELPSIASQSSTSKLLSKSVEDPQKIIRLGISIIFVFFGVLGLWGSFAKISGAVVAPGTVKIETERKTVQHLEGGIVEAILVKDGDRVKAGDSLIILESSQVDASHALYAKQLYSQKAAHVRLLAEKNWSKSIEWPDAIVRDFGANNVQDFMVNEDKIFAARREAINGQISLLNAQIEQIRSQIVGFEEQYQSENTIVGTLEEELRAKRQLFNERYIDKSQILELERMLASHQGNRGRLQQSIAEAKQRSSELKLRISDLKNRFIEESTNQLGKVENEILQLQERIRPLKDAKERLIIMAPVTGQVVGLKVHSNGGVVRPGEPLMDIVPDDNPLIVETHIPVNKVTEVYVGQEAQVQLDAFDRHTTPLIKGKVTYISGDRIEDRTAQGIMPYFIGHVQLEPVDLAAAKVYLSPGMPATVFVTTKQRTVLAYMMEPLLVNWDRALRE